MDGIVLQKVKGFDGGWWRTKGGGNSPSQPPYAVGLNIGEIPINLTEVQNQGKGPKVRKPWKCMPKVALTPSMKLRYLKIRDRIQCILDHALIGNFFGMQPSEKTLFWKTKSTWKPKGHFDLHLGSKEFFSILFISFEYRNRILDGGPYFYYSTGLFLLS